MLSFLAIALAIVLGVCVPSLAKAGQYSSSSSTSTSKSNSGQKADKKPAETPAEEDVDVGTFYMHKGDYGAAISRFDSAVRRDPKNAKARLLLADCYDKQHNWAQALQAYQDYLREFPGARDAKKIRKKIAELSHKRN
ncbi:MAG TPA: tetratricopeptide repeat protein [Candidatus Dormibacteraeota bacterium]|nr:tetratricopeptide repeat protein [Candidatus Dormibacteraeota bacterium]